MCVFKASKNRLASMVFEEGKKIEKNPQNMEFFNRYVLSLVPIEEFYIKSKLSESKQI